MRLKLTLLALLFMPFIVAAAEKPQELSGTIRAEVPVGTAQMRALFLSVYEVSFWSDSADWKRAPYALTINYDMRFSADELADRTYEEMKNISDVPDIELKAYADTLRMIYPPISEGDRVTALRKDSATYFYHNGKRIGKVSGSAFADAFFGIWLSPKSSEPDMQKQLLPSSH